ncbi:hypothetical protein RRG08_034251 [Elysia crispata]|uniref:Uncharacterized protein n=1 Tax=Elysia crispata TaxID=231223 RepID=A0AAE1DRH4_9GAST|nr:hypothetical protein RRG08_034251 [Elysia crispata]
MYFGIKNDKNRKGFEVRLQPASTEKLDPVACLKSYLSITRSLAHDDGPTFLSLIPSHDGLSAAGVSDILRETIRDAGLDEKKFTPRSFRPTGASASKQATIPRLPNRLQDGEVAKFSITRTFTLSLAIPSLTICCLLKLCSRIHH